jgi:unconventional prefoldin RPB5 interactor 1
LGSTLTELEVDEILGIKNGGSIRSRPQILSVLTNRIRYVQQNVGTVSKQLEAAEEKLAKTMILQQPDNETEEGLPLMEIREELDEDGNVISSSLSQPGQDAEKVLETLKKAGITEFGEEKPEKTPKEDSKPTKKDPPPSSSDAPAKKEAAPKKSVSFASEVQTQEAPKVIDPVVQRHGAPAFGDAAFTEGTDIIELNEFDEEIGRRPIVLPDESPDDAALRREMLRYHLNETGAVVAELELEEGSDYDEDDVDLRDLDDYDSEYDDDDDSELENEWGRSLKREVSDDVHREMQALERRLNATMIKNLGPRPDASQDTKRLVVMPDDEVQKSIRSKSSEKNEADEDATNTGDKKVRFAENLDISAMAPPSSTASSKTQPSETESSVIADSVFERPPSTTESPSTTSRGPPKKVSRFKAARATSSQASPSTDPENSAFSSSGKTLSDSILERAPTVAPVAGEPGQEDELDPAVHQRQITDEYYRLRNKMIQSQPGGFMPSEIEKQDPLYEERDGKVKKVSRFRAARLGGGM